LFDDFSHERGADCESGFDLLGGAEVKGEVADRQLLPDFDGFVGPVTFKGEDDHDVEVGVFVGLAIGVGAEEDDLFGLGNGDDLLGELGDFFGCDHGRGLGRRLLGLILACLGWR
jgi:hypothetical protein